mgnify:CR=1 FL=1
MRYAETWMDYEKLIGDVLKTYYENRDGCTYELKYGRDNCWIGASSYQHQIDVSLSFDSRIILAECKFWNKPIDVPGFLTFLARIMDIKAAIPGDEVEGIVITITGFDRGVSTLAAYYGIDLQIIYENLHGFDWSPLIENLLVSRSQSVPIHVDE